MTTIIPFTPTNLAPFTFGPVLDGQPYNAIVTWALWGQRPYLNLFSASGPLVVTKAIVSSLDPVSTPLTTIRGSYLASVVPVESPSYIDINWSVSSINVPSGTTLGAVTPSGLVRLSQPALVTGTDQTASFSFVFDLIAGYGFDSTMVFNESSMSFIITP